MRITPAATPPAASTAITTTASAEVNKYNETDFVNNTNRTIADIAVEKNISVEEFINMYNLPAEVIGKDKVTVRITPAEARFFHLSKDPAKNVEIPVVHDKVRSNNKSNATFRLGSVFVDYK